MVNNIKVSQRKEEKIYLLVLWGWDPSSWKKPEREKLNMISFLLSFTPFYFSNNLLCAMLSQSHIFKKKMVGLFYGMLTLIVLFNAEVSLF